VVLCCGWSLGEAFLLRWDVAAGVFCFVLFQLSPCCVMVYFSCCWILVAALVCGLRGLMLCMVGVIMGSPLRMPPTRSHLYLGASSTVSGSVVSFSSLGALCWPFSLLSFGRACPVVDYSIKLR
jgi:hypothetical protein